MANKKFKIGDIIEFHPREKDMFSARVGALAQVVGFRQRNDDRRRKWVSVIWLKDQKGQVDGNYYPRDFVLLVRPKI